MNDKRKIKLQNFELVFGLLMIFGFLGIAIMAPVLSPPRGDFPELTYIMPRDGFKDYPLPPNPDHPFGTLPDQYDIYYGLVWGTRRAFILGISITLGRAFIGVVLGLISGYYKGFLSSLIMRVTDAFMSMPSIAAAALMFALFGELAIPFFSPGGGFSDPTTLLQNENRNVFIIVLSLIIFGWMQYARLIRANVISEREREYVQAAKSIGAPNRRVIFKHILPNGIKGLFVLIASDIGSMVAVVSLFYFIGLIGRYPYGLVADWGQILSESRDWIVGPPSQPLLYWYTYIPAISIIALFTIAWSMLGDGLRDLFDPRVSMRRRRKKKSSIFTKWFGRRSQAQSQIPVYPTIQNLRETLPEESELDPLLIHAREALKREDLSEAFHAYTHLVWDEKNVGTVIRDLQALTWKYPEAVEAWSVLGEALRQIGREQDAQQVFVYYRKLKAREESRQKGNVTWNRSLLILGLLLLTVGLIFIVFNRPDGGQPEENIPNPTVESLAESIDPLPTITPTDTPWGLYLPTPKTPLPTRTPTVSASTPIPSEQSTSIADITDLPACIPDNPSQRGRVVEIIDGNTVKVLIGEYVYVVRYIGIDVPNTSEPDGTEAAFKNADLVYRKDVTLIPDQTDQDARGRLLRYVLVGDTFVNYELVAQGFARAADAPLNPACAELFQGAVQ